MTQSRKEKASKRVKNAKAACGDPKSHDPWTALQVDRNEKAKGKDGKDGHKEAFTYPYAGSYYPYWGVSMYTPVGCVGFGLQLGSRSMLMALDLAGSMAALDTRARLDVEAVLLAEVLAGEVAEEEVDVEAAGVVVAVAAAA